MSIPERISGIIKDLSKRQKISPHNRLVNSFMYGFDNQDEAGREAFIRRLNGESLPTDPKLKDLISGRKSTSR
ncbi:hypothetical protein A2394_01240 [Candidatus Woesebacteria bacterium RIFOXYB1_FULL_42_36]|uniref:Uncharacterized protein n=1 Tax=Candidatus Woesebacteria bacterium RIFOXYD1_FULL_43_18 TaxID=1802551 RepID=A0A1F8DIT6_9BACT|nr:MAG: hypothetical protein A2208_02455 [Candidatus Woesebacteria bacterium RIFOXYA1_FULL_43_16]OGM81395.1 MAG: hypothetical protein A2394_01240 [Candidatus Woesebacteria bacterium RIFOXYB1_FULL_42_36]OGM83579.1 MAG: hypothetical protein A2421_01070 [Candidatus Woesebacteria bacterium RIFOXYC1_FULL_43_18]OGM88517.1 MAG: hypothetical protein A2573_02935 [Candidatus Woesebacteria bacterium RIFOXYD1_FULL_43_18]